MGQALFWVQQTGLAAVIGLRHLIGFHRLGWFWGISQQTVLLLLIFFSNALHASHPETQNTASPGCCGRGVEHMGKLALLYVDMWL